MHTLYSLDDQSLSMSVVDLTVIVIEYAFSFIRKVWLVVTSLSHDYQGVIAHASSLTSMRKCSLFVIGLPDNDCPGITSVPKDEGILFAVARDKGAATQFTVELGLLLQLCLDAKEGRDHSFLNVFEE